MARSRPQVNEEHLEMRVAPEPDHSRAGKTTLLLFYLWLIH